MAPNLSKSKGAFHKTNVCFCLIVDVRAKACLPLSVDVGFIFSETLHEIIDQDAYAL